MKSTYPVHVPPCPGCSNPESCGACYQKLYPEDRQKLRAGRSPEGRSPSTEAPRAPRGAIYSCSCGGFYQAGTYVHAETCERGGLDRRTLS